MTSFSIVDENTEDVTGAVEGVRNHSFNMHVGERVAKFFEGHYINRGTVVQLEQILGKSYCLVVYDDLETERVAPNELPGKSHLALSDGLEMIDLTTLHSLIFVPLCRYVEIV